MLVIVCPEYFERWIDAQHKSDFVREVYVPCPIKADGLLEPVPTRQQRGDSVECVKPG